MILRKRTPTQAKALGVTYLFSRMFSEQAIYRQAETPGLSQVSQLFGTPEIRSRKLSFLLRNQSKLPSLLSLLLNKAHTRSAGGLLSLLNLRINPLQNTSLVMSFGLPLQLGSSDRLSP